MKADLHVHSSYSDGSDNITELAKKLELAGVDIFALTDHDTIESCIEMRKIISDKIYISSTEPDFIVFGSGRRTERTWCKR